ncbi:MAG: methyl-accepting chemotaxis protein [Elusimicrobia bacterium]|nr:methyl-accepting chemotaxis protein [Elusimicrobiota bacterium]
MGGDAPTQKFQRRTVLVKQHLQVKYALVVFAAVVFTAMIVGGDVYYTMARFVKETDPSLMPLLSDAMRMDLVKLVIFLGIMGIVTLFVSHRWAGPIYRFERSAEIVSTGDLTHRVSLRTGDDLMELQDEFNAMITSLQRLVQKDRTLVERLQVRLDEALKRLPETAGAADLERLKGELRELKDELKHATSAFKV